jgi:hypothetical protein
MDWETDVVLIFLGILFILAGLNLMGAFSRRET